MGYKAIYSPQAIERLKLIVSRIAEDNPNAALRFGMRLLDHAELLADFPELGRAYAKRHRVRRLLCKPYFICYRLNEDERIVEIMEFWHTSQLEPEL